MLASRVGVLVILGALELLGGAVGSADAATPCGANGVLSGAGTHFSCEYTTVGEDTFSVSAGLTSVSVVATGAPGGNGGLYDSASADGAPGGFGAVVTDRQSRSRGRSRCTSRSGGLVGMAWESTGARAFARAVPQA